MSIIEDKNISVSCGGPRNGRFSARLDLCGNGVDNHVLLITMRVYLKMVTAIDNWVTIPEGFDVTPFKWTVAEWAQFKRKFMLSGEVWNRKFCLIPPDSADKLKYGGGLFRSDYMPNVECQFKLEESDEGSRHWTVEVLKSAKNISEHPNTGIGKAELDSNSADPQAKKLLDGTSILQTAASHEIGHMLGQPHSGALKNTADCARAIELNLDESPADKPVAKYLLHGQNASACYGFVEGKLVPGVGENIMGLGSVVTEINAISWQKALAKLVWQSDSLPGNWSTVMRSYVGPRQLK